MGSARGWCARFAPVVVAAIAALPFAEAFAPGRAFYVRDLSIFFWQRHLWLRRSLWSGVWPLWDPTVAGGQPAASDPLHQMFLLPVLALRLLGSETFGFNLWVALPFPLAALGAWLFLSRRFSRPASAVGALAFALSGPVVAAGNFPNLSWAVAAMPWVCFATDRLAADPRARAVVWLGLAVAAQALAGEPVTLAATLVVALAMPPVLRPRGARTALAVGAVAAGIALGLALAAVQLLPLGNAVAGSLRAAGTGQAGGWSVHPLALAETVSLHLFGDYYSSASLAAVPWMAPLNGGREPFFFSLYFGPPLLALAVAGALGSARSRWSVFWMAVGLAALVASFGDHTPVYPAIRRGLPILAVFRFPAKYLLVTALAVGALAASGWDVVAGAPEGKWSLARGAGVGAAGAIALAAGLLSAIAIFDTGRMARWGFDAASGLGAADPIAAAAFLVHALPARGAEAMAIALAAAGLLALVGSARRAPAAVALFVLVVGDLAGHAWGINPTMSEAYLRRPEWMAALAGPMPSFYVGGAIDGTFDAGDLDAPRGFFRAPGLSVAESRAALNVQAAYAPEAWGGRQLWSYDPALLWPRDVRRAHDRFLRAGRAERDRFLSRTGVRYRVLPAEAAGAGSRGVAIPYMADMRLFDAGRVTPRASVVSEAVVVSDVVAQVEHLFDPSESAARVVAIDRQADQAGLAGPAREPAATVTRAEANRLVVDAAVGSGGGYLVILDSYSPDWRASVDGWPARVLRANGLFRAVRLAPGRHVVDMGYHPTALVTGGAVSAGAFLLVGVLFTIDRRRRATGPSGTQADEQHH